MYQKIDLNLGVRYEAKIGNLGFGPLKESDLESLFSDGRICGRMVEPLLPTIFNDLVCVIGGNSKFDLTRISNGKKQEVKTYTKSSGCKLIPSSQIGKGRKYSKSEFHKRAQQMESYIIVDIREFPNINIISHSSNHILLNYSTGINIPATILDSQIVVSLGELKK